MASSLFAGLFPSSEKRKDDLFAKSNKYRNPRAGLTNETAAEALASSGTRPAAQASRSRDPSAGTPPSQQGAQPRATPGGNDSSSSGKRHKSGKKATEPSRAKQHPGSSAEQRSGKPAAKTAAPGPVEKVTGERKGAEKAGGEKKGAEKAATTKSPPAPATGTETKPAVKGADTTSTRKRSAGRAEPSGEPAPKRKAAKALGKQASVPPVPGAAAELDSRAAGSAAADLDSPAERGEGGGVPGTAPLTGPSGAGVPTPKPASSVEALARTVFVGNLPPGTNRKAVRRLLAPCGAVQSVRLRSLAVKQDVKMPRRSAVRAGEIDQARGSGHAYVVFAGAAAVDKALALNMTEHEGRHLRVDRAVEDRAIPGKHGAAPSGGGAGVVYEPSRSVFLGNLARSVEDEDVIQFFTTSRVSTELKTALEAVRVVRDRKTTLGKGVAFALFKTRSAARSALLMDGKPLAGRAVRITRVSSGAGAAGTQAWQGVKATRKRGAGPAAAHLEQRGVGVKKGKSPSAKRGPGQKRPAVAARKALQRAQRKRGGA